MLATAHRLLIRTLAPLACLLAMPHVASADNFGPYHYDRATDELVVTVLYGGTNPHHTFTLKWGSCEVDDSGRRMPLANADVLDDQFNDVEQQQYKIVVRLNLAGMPCPRPAIVTLSSPPSSSITLVIPK
jgi:hypothetical protein